MMLTPFQRIISELKEKMECQQRFPDLETNPNRKMQAVLIYGDNIVDSIINQEAEFEKSNTFRYLPGGNKISIQPKEIE